MKFLWITDPWDTLDHPRDTTLRLIEESLRMGHESYWCDSRTIRAENGAVLLEAKKVTGVRADRSADSFTFEKVQTTKPSVFERLLYRVDPPVDHGYIHPLHLLVVGVEGYPKAEIVNLPNALLTINEKIEGESLTETLRVPGIIASQLETLERFGKSEKKAVLKPLFQAQSKGAELLSWESESSSAEAREKLRKASLDFTQPVLLQRYLPAIEKGEQRLWFVNGKLIANARKIPKAGEFRINMDQGATVAKSDLTAAEQTAAESIGVHLAQRKIRLAAVDLIDGKVTDFNHTSPGLITQMEEVLGINLAALIINGLIESLP